MTVWAIILAAGGGGRFGERKQFADLDGRSVIHWALRSADLAGCRTVAVVPPEVADKHRHDATLTVAGGATRSESVRAGLAAVPVDAEIILVHDAARPMATPALWRRLIEAVQDGARCAVPVLDLVDSVRTVDGFPFDRSKIRTVQTPQAFQAGELREAHAERPECTDDAGLFVDVVMVSGEPTNFKITWPDDLVMASAARRVACRSRS